MTLVAGSYEKFIWGFSLKTLKPGDEETLALALKPLFSYPSHTAPIKSIAVAGPVAVSGGADDAIKIYDLASAVELGTLLDHSGAVTALAFYTPPRAPSLPRNLLSASDDGAVCIYDADPFVHLKTVATHRRGVADLAVHPSGRVALTVGRDSCLAMLNLVRRRRSFSCRLAQEASIVRYGLEDGERFFMVAEERISVHDSEDARLIHELDAPKRVLCIAPAENGLLFTGGEDRSVTAWDTASGKVACCIQDAHSTRVKCLVVFKRSSDGQTSETSNFIVSASSDGVIRIWDVRMTSNEKPNPLAEVNTKSRLTCLAGSSLK
ncbi:p21-activated protein kinase-interacting protein 1-like [Cocos nucifera]|uniref:p21-activated protein kinase-interacting protein 1-like n=1 Tax=Cocos nucifera TaxID=13894 RepID=A0A8K0N3N6_COCNU|nr:p21-activated protein kinase-interacting protein 1-like [Cocos nucifera]